MRKQKRLALLIALMSPAVVWAQQMQAPTVLTDAAQKAVSNNPEVQARLHAFNAAREEIDVARGGYFPRVDLTAGVGRERLREPGFDSQSFTRRGASINLNQMLWDGLATRNEVRRLGHAKLTRYYELLDASENAALEASRAYYDVLRYRQLVALAEENYVQHRSVFEQIQRKVQAGAGRRVDFEQASGRLALAESNLLTETANLHDVSARYQRVVGETPPGSLPPAGMFKDIPAQANELQRIGQAKNPAIAAAIENIRAAQADADGRKAPFQPKVDFRLRQEWDKNRDGILGTRNDGVAEVVLNYNLFNGGSDVARTRQFAERLNNAKDLRDKACRDVRQTVAIAYNDTRKLSEQLNYLDQHQTSIEKARDAYRKQFDIGQRTLLDLLDTENELFQAKRAYVNGEHDLGIAYVRTKAGVGDLLATLGLTRLDTGNQPELQNWEAGSDAPERCPPEAPAPVITNKAALNSRAAGLVPVVEPSAVAPAASVASAPGPDAGVVQGVRDWASAWSSKNFDAYSAFYAPGFQTGKMSKQAWIAQRRARVTKPGDISVQVEDITALTKGADRAVTTFRQTYRSANFSDTSAKSLEWIKVNGRWLIERESNR